MSTSDVATPLVTGQIPRHRRHLDGDDLTFDGSHLGTDESVTPPTSSPRAG